MILVTCAVILICCSSFFFFPNYFFLTEVREIVLFPSSLFLLLSSHFQLENKKGNRGIGNKAKKKNESSDFFWLQDF